MEIPGYSNYTIDLDGNIWSKKRKIFKKSYIDRGGYELISLMRDDGKQKSVLVHRAVGLTFLPNPENKPEIDHIDRNPLNNNYLNLRWVTHLENGMNKGLSKSSKTGYENILIIKRDNKKIFLIQFQRLGKLYRRYFSINKYSLEEVVKIRNQIYKEFNIQIRD